MTVSKYKIGDKVRTATAEQMKAFDMQNNWVDGIVSDMIYNCADKIVTITQVSEFFSGKCKLRFAEVPWGWDSRWVVPLVTPRGNVYVGEL